MAKQLRKILISIMVPVYIGYDILRSMVKKKKLSDAHKGLKWWSCDELEKTVSMREEDLDKNYIWYNARKYIKNKLSKLKIPII